MKLGDIATLAMLNALEPGSTPILSARGPMRMRMA